MGKVVMRTSLNDWDLSKEREEKEWRDAAEVVSEDYPRTYSEGLFSVRMVVSRGDVRNFFEVWRWSRMYYETLVFESREEKEKWESGELEVEAMKVTNYNFFSGFRDDEQVI